MKHLLADIMKSSKPEVEEMIGSGYKVMQVDHKVKVTRLQCYKFTRLQGYKVTRLQGYKVDHTYIIVRHQVLLYNGQLDVVVAHTLTQSFIDSMMWPGKELFDAAPRNKWWV